MLRAKTLLPPDTNDTTGTKFCVLDLAGFTSSSKHHFYNVTLPVK